ncbi:MAG: diaminopimelate decarboxylase [Microbacteriaceae bacterium]
MSAQADFAREREIWPAQSRLNESGELLISDVPVSALVAEFGTPLYVIDETEVRERAQRIRAVFASAAARIGTEVQVYYAGKALLTAEIARWMSEAGLGLDVASGGELAIALAGGMPAKRIGLHGNNKSVAEIERAIVAGVGSIVIDSPIEIERIAAVAERHGVVQPVRLRVNSGVHAHTHDFLATAHEDQKFGVSIVVAPTLVARIRELPHLQFLGLHCHIGSQIFEAGGFAESAARLLTLQRDLLAGGAVPELNLGGGFGIAYVVGDEPLPIEDLAELIFSEVAQVCTDLNIAVPKLAFEPGRWLVGNAGVTLYEVGTVKPVQLEGGLVRSYVSVDGGMSDNARPALYGAEYTARVVGRFSDAELVASRVAGKHCESGDVLVQDALLPADVTPGDVLAVAATGAYCSSLSNNYNALLRPAMVAVANGAARLIVRRETETDLLARDLGVLENS